MFLLFRFCLRDDVLKACNIVVLHFYHVFTAVNLLFELVNLLHVLGILVFGGGQGTFGTSFNTLDESAEAVLTYEMSDQRAEPRGVGSWMYL